MMSFQEIDKLGVSNEMLSECDSLLSKFHPNNLINKMSILFPSSINKITNRFDFDNWKYNHSEHKFLQISLVHLLRYLIKKYLLINRFLSSAFFSHCNSPQSEFKIKSGNIDFF
jgi:hypothetical protein